MQEIESWKLRKKINVFIITINDFEFVCKFKKKSKKFDKILLDVTNRNKEIHEKLK